MSISGSIWAQAVEIKLFADGEERVIPLELVDIEGVGYLPLPILMEQVGGAYNMLPARLRVDFAGTTAWLSVDDNRVNALSIFSLSQDIREIDGVTFIALDDVPPFFLKSFRSRIGFELLDAEMDTDDVQPGEEPGTVEDDGRTDVATIPTRGLAGPIRVVLDAGHGGYDFGLESETGFAEKDIVLDVALRLKALLESDGSGTVVLTRSEDVGLTAAQRVQVVRDSQADIVISLHASGSMSGATRGASVLFVGPASRGARGALAGGSGVSGGGSVQHDRIERSRTLASAVGDGLSSRPGVSVRGVHHAPVRFLAAVGAPGILVEVGCLTSAFEANALGSDAYRGELAEGIFSGVIAYVDSLPESVATADDAGVERLKSLTDF